MKKRNLYLLHRWLGIVLCLFFTLWFITGVVMLYARMPLLFPAERVSGLEAIPFSRAVLTPGEAWRAMGEPEATPARVRLVMTRGRPTYLFLIKGAKWQGVFADTGEKLESVSVSEGAEEARRFQKVSELPRHVSSFDGIDQWTFSNSLNLHRPLHRYRFSDADQTEVYVSQITGEVVNRSTQGERLGAAIGAYAHWLAPSLLRREATLWRNTLLILSLGGTLLTLTGLIIGMLRFRREGYRNRTGIAGKLPYQGVMAWHAWSGLLFGVATLGWIFSGVLYMNPGGKKSGPLNTTTTVTPFNEGGIRANTSALPEQAIALSGGPLDLRYFTRSVGTAARQVGFPVKEVELLRFGGRPYYLYHGSESVSLIVSAADSSEPVRIRFSREELLERAAKAVGDAPITEAVLLSEYDAYYYSVGAVAPKRLPILRVKFGDRDGTWLYINPHNGTIFRRYDHHGRLMRWLVNGLHCLDFPFLIRHRPLWDIAVIGLSVGGMILSLAGVYLAGKRLRRV